MKDNQQNKCALVNNRLTKGRGKGRVWLQSIISKLTDRHIRMHIKVFAPKKTNSPVMSYKENNYTLINCKVCNY